MEERCARWLLMTHDRAGENTFPLTQEFLGQMMGVQRNAISIVAHQLQQAGTIRYSRGQVAIANVEALRKSACECYHAVKAAHDRLLSAR